MDYTIIYETWKKEKENKDLQRLEKQFYLELSQHIKSRHEELQMIDEKTLMVKLAIEENKRTEYLLKDLMWSRYGKIFNSASCGKHVSMDLLTSEEEIINRDILSAFERIKSLEKDILGGHVPKLKGIHGEEKPRKTLLVRFVQAIPAIVGPNGKTFGPFKAEDIASLPIENAESLIKHGIAVKVDTE